MKSNRFYHYLHACEDLLKRNKVEDFFKNSPTIQLIVNPRNGSVINANLSALNFYGYAESGIRKMNFDRISTINRKDFLTLINYKSAKLSSLPIETKHCLHSGEVRDVSVYSAPIRIGIDTFIYLTVIDITEQKKLEAALKITEEKLLNNQREERYKSLFDANFSVMLLVNPDTGEITDANVAASKFYGWTTDEIKSKNISEINTLSQEAIHAEMQKAKLENRNYFIFKHRLASGEIRDVEVYSGPISFPDKTLLYSIVHDIAEKTRIENALRKSEDNYRFMFENNPQPMWIIDQETLAFLEVNTSTIEHYGYSRKEFLNMTIKDIRPQEFHTDLLENIEQSKHADPQKNWTSEWIHCKKSGELIDVEIVTHRIHFNGRPAFHSLVNDITEQKRSALQLEKTRMNYQGFFNTIDEFVFILDMNGHILHANPVVYNRLGYTAEELIGQPVTLVHPIDRREEAVRVVGEMLVGTTDMCTIPLLTKSGMQIPVETRVKEGTWNSQPVIFGFTKDITEIKLSEEKFSKVFHLNPSPASLSDLEETRIIEFNDAFYNIFGYSKEEAIGKTPLELGMIPAESQKVINEKLVGNRLADKLEIDLISKNGDKKRVQMSAELIEVQGKKFRYTVLHDITELKHAETEITNKVNLLTNLIINLEEGVLLENSNREIILTNQLFCDMFGIPAPPEILVGSDCSDSAEQSKGLFKNPDKFVSDINKILEERKVVLSDQLELIDGRYFERDYLPTFLDGEYNGHLWKYRDVTPKKKAEIELRDSHALYQSFVEQMPAGVIRLDEDGRIIFVNSLFCEIEHISCDNIIGQKIDELSENQHIHYTASTSGATHNPGTFSQNDAAHHQQIMETGETIQFEEKHELSNGTNQYLQVVKYPVFSSTGKVIGSQGIIFDITERKLAEDTLSLHSELQKLLLEISAGYINLPVDAISDNLNTTLNKIANFVGADRAYIFEYDFEHNVSNNTYEWCEDGIAPQINELQEVPIDAISDWVNTHLKGEPLFVDDVLALAPGSLREILEPQDIKSLMTVPLMNNNNCTGFVGFDWVKHHHAFRDSEFTLLKGFSQMLVNLQQKSASEIALIDSKEQLKNFAGHLQNVREEERVALAREIHDDLGQNIVALKIDVGLLKNKMLKEYVITPEVDKNLTLLQDLVENSIISTRRILSGLRPETIERLGFIGAVSEYIEDFGKRSKIRVKLESKIDNVQINPKKSIALYRILQESMNNIIKHAMASEVRISLYIKENELILKISDNGIGFDTEKKQRKDSYGLLGMKERVYLLDGEFSISSEVNKGTEVMVLVPLEVTGLTPNQDFYQEKFSVQN